MRVRYIPSSDLPAGCPLAHRLTPTTLVAQYAPQHLDPALAEALAHLGTDLFSVEHDLLDEPADDPDRWVVVDRKAAGPPLAYDLGPTYLLLQPRADLLTPIMATALELTGTRLARRIRRR